MSGKYIPIEINSLKQSSRDISFDIFMKLGDENYAHVFSKTSGIDYVRLAQYVKKGITHLYVRDEDQEAYKQFLTRTPGNILSDPNISNAKKISLLLNMAEKNISDFFTIVQVPQDMAESSTKIVKNFIKMMGEDPKSLTLLLKTASHGDYLYYHAISTAIISMFLAKACKQSNPRMLEICGLGGFLHDIGLTKLPKEIVDSPTELTPSEWREMRMHPKLGIEMLDGTQNIPDEIRFIILQHHEEPRGTGYPNRISGPVIFFPAKIVALADSFCALITKRPFREAYSVPEAIGIIQHEIGKYDKELVHTLSELFSPKQAQTVKKAA